MSSPTLSNSARRAKKTVPEDDVVDWAAMILPKVVTLAAERRQYTGWLKIKYHRRICNISATNGLILKILEAA